MLFLGNSYTFMGNLDEVTLALFIAAGGEPTSERLAQPGMRFIEHVAEIQRDGSAWQLAFQSPQDWVFLQEQSQIPGFPDGQSDLVQSQAAAVSLDSSEPPVSDPSPPMMTSPSMPRFTRLSKPFFRPSGVLNSMLRAVPRNVPPRWIKSLTLRLVS